MKSELLSSVQAVAEFMPPKKDDIDFLETAVFRKAETDMLKKILSDNKVCIINGMAGIGKTYFAKMYSYLRENVVYISDSYFCNRDLENRVIDHSFARSIKSNSLLIIDDIDGDINHYVSSSFFAPLR